MSQHVTAHCIEVIWESEISHREYAAEQLAISLHVQKYFKSRLKNYVWFLSEEIFIIDEIIIIL